jgi:hypothetical protein
MVRHGNWYATKYVTEFLVLKDFGGSEYKEIKLMNF